MKQVISLKKVTKKFGEQTLWHNLSLDLQARQITVLTGPSGIGKSTLLRCLVLLESFDEGEFWLNGKLVARDGEVLNKQLVREKIGLVFQDFYLWENMTISDNIIEPLVTVKKISRKEAIVAAETVCLKLAISPDLGSKYPSQLSRGQRQRVAIARSLVMEPEILLLDEPTASLDGMLVQNVIALCKSLKRSTTILIVTHDLVFAEKVGDKVVKTQDLFVGC